MMMTTGAKEAEIASGLTGTTINWVDNLAGLRAMAHAMTAPVVVKGYDPPATEAVGSSCGMTLPRWPTTMGRSSGRTTWRPRPPVGGSGSTPDRST